MTSAALAVPAVTFAFRPAFAAEPPIFATNGIAINGYDPVAYFADSAPVAGDAAISSEWDGATFLFASNDNRSAFEADTEKFAPKYGGHGAYAVSKGETAKTDPDAGTVHDDRLYLNFSKQVRWLWLKSVEKHIARGDENWPGVLMA